MAQLQPQVKQMFLGNNGLPLVGGKLYTYLGGTTTPKATFSDPEGLVPNPNPVILDARGEALIFWTGTYKVKLADALDNPIYTVDNVQEVSPAYRTSATGSLITPSGTTAQRDSAPQVGYARWNTSLGVFEIWNGAVWANAFVGSGASSGPGGSPLSYRNKIIGGDCRISRRGATALSGTLAYGGCDNILTSGLNVTSGNVAQSTNPTASGACGFSQAVNVVSSSGSGEVDFETRMESADTRSLAGKQVTISASLWQDTGVPVTATMRLSSAGATDNFTTRNILQDSPPIIIPSGTLTRVTFTTNAVSYADAIKGLATAVFMQFTGILANKFFTISDWQLEEGNAATPFEVRPWSVEQQMLARFLPFFRGSIAGFQPIGSAVGMSATTALGLFQFSMPTLFAPTGLVASAAADFGVTTNAGSTGVAATSFAFSSASRFGAVASIGAAAGLAAGVPGFVGPMTSAATLYFTGCQL